MFYSIFFFFWFLIEENVIVSKNCTKENNKRIGEEDQDSKEEIENFPVELIVRMTDKQLVVVP